MQWVAKGDARAFEELYDRYSGRMLNYFHRMLWQDREKAEDFMQDLFTKIIRKPDAFDPSRTFKTWLFSVANNMCKNEYKKQSIRKDSNYELKEDQAIGNGSGEILSGIDAGNFKEALYQELEQMDEKHRTTFILRYIEELSIKEISQALNCSEGTVKSRLFYTLKKLTPRLKDFDPRRNEIYDE